MPHSYTVTLTPKEVYSKEDVFIPPEYQIVRFGIPKVGETYLEIFGNVITRTETFGYCSDTSPRYILELRTPKASTGSTEVFRTVNYRKATREELAQNLRFYYETESGGMRLFVGQDLMEQSKFCDLFVRY
jgi:hypothetical protein